MVGLTMSVSTSWYVPAATGALPLEIETPKLMVSFPRVTGSNFELKEENPVFGAVGTTTGLALD